MKNGRGFVFRLPKGCDIHTELAAFCGRERVRTAWVSGLGAVTEATLGYYDQKRRRYFDKRLRAHLELLSCVGNVSLKDGKPFVHLHVTLGDEKYRVLGGHLFECAVFAAELHVRELAGKPLERVPDTETGLALWPCRL